MTSKEILEALVWIPVAGVAVPVLVLFVECVAALWPRRTPPAGVPLPGPRVTVILPAHNEEAGIGDTLRSIRPQLDAGDRVLVIADNCKDSTADRARAEGAEVLERRDEIRRGKGYALAAGLDHLNPEPPDVVVFVDADTPVGPGTIRTLRESAWSHGRPAQAVYLLDPPEGAGVTSAVSSFAFLTKNLVRPAGLARLGVPCHLLGTGMAIPWKLIDVRKLATGNIVEDMQLGIDLAIAGHPPMLCLEALVHGRLPSASPAARVQRTRWEHGHLSTILSQSPRLAWQGLRRGRPWLLGMALDLAVPPLALLCLVWAVAAGASLALALKKLSPLPLMVSGGSGALLVLAVFLSWVRHARGRIPGRVLVLAPIYILWKIPLYAAFLFRRQKAWVRTPRDPSTDAARKDEAGGSAS